MWTLTTTIFSSVLDAPPKVALAAAARGRASEVRFDPAGGGAVTLAFENRKVAPSPLFNAIPHRQSTRTEYDGKAATSDELRALSAAAAVPSVNVALLTGKPQISNIRDLVISANTSQMADDAFIRELKSWLRFNPRQAMAAGDGLYSGSSGIQSLPSWLAPVRFDLAFKTKSENEKYVRQLNSSAGVAVFVAEQSDQEHWIRTGRACQRFALQAAALGLRRHILISPSKSPAFGRSWPL